MIQMRNFLRPAIVLLLIYLLQMTIYTFYSLGAIKSFKIDFISHDAYGYIDIFIFYFSAILISFIVRGTKEQLTLKCVKVKRIYFLIYLSFACSLYGMYHAGSYLFYNFGLLEVLKLAFTGESVDYIVTGSGNIILSAFALLATILIGTIFEKKNKKHRFLLLVALGILFFYSSILNSRILFIQGIIFFAVIYYRKFHYSSQISRKNIILYSIIGVLFLVLTSGYRDYNKEGRLYTKSVMQWGITRISDYVVSTTNYSLEMPNLAVGYGFPNNVLPIINRIWDSQNDWHYDFVSIQQNYGSAEYTNKGSFGQIFLDFQNYFIPFVLFIGLLYALVWKNFDKGKVFGYFFYPIFLYNLLESMRIFYLGTEPAEFLLLLCLSSYLICKKSYVVE